MKIQSEIRKWGNSLALRITSNMASALKISDGTMVIVEVTNDGLIIKKATKPKKQLKLPYNEKSLLEGMTPYTAHSDELAVLNHNELGD